jgi:hypothetical protein
MTRTLDTISGELFDCIISEDQDGRVWFTSGAKIDADGANGQHGGPPAYTIDDSGSELLANGGMAIVGQRVTCSEDWARDIVILGRDGEPKVFPGGVIASITWYKYPGVDPDSPLAYVDAETIPYIVVPPVIVNKTKGIVCGCKARVPYQGKSVDCIVADLGPKNKIGELSIAAARSLEMPSSPKNGGTDEPEVCYELWPGRAAPGFVLQPAT